MIGRFRVILALIFVLALSFLLQSCSSDDNEGVFNDSPTAGTGSDLSNGESGDSSVIAIKGILGLTEVNESVRIYSYHQNSLKEVTAVLLSNNHMEFFSYEESIFFIFKEKNNLIDFEEPFYVFVQEKETLTTKLFVDGNFLISASILKNVNQINQLKNIFTQFSVNGSLSIDEERKINEFAQVALTTSTQESSFNEFVKFLGVSSQNESIVSYDKYFYSERDNGLNPGQRMSSSHIYLLGLEQYLGESNNLILSLLALIENDSMVNVWLEGTFQQKIIEEVFNNKLIDENYSYESFCQDLWRENSWSIEQSALLHSIDEEINRQVNLLNGGKDKQTILDELKNFILNPIASFKFP